MASDVRSNAYTVSEFRDRIRAAIAVAWTGAERVTLTRVTLTSEVAERGRFDDLLARAFPESQGEEG